MQDVWTAYLKAARQLDLQPVRDATAVLVDAYRRRALVVSAGNGGSAATAAHFAADLSKFATYPAPGFRALDLLGNLSLTTAWVNDESWDGAHEAMLQPWIGPGDVLVAFSVHGAAGWSSNLARALEYARGRGAATIGVAGAGGGRFPDLCDVAIVIPTPADVTLTTPVTESLHVAVHHLICAELRRVLSTGSGG